MMYPVSLNTIQNRPHASFGTLFVNQEKRLRGLVIRCLDCHRKGVESNVRAVGDEVTAIETSVPVSEAINGYVTIGLVPLCDCLVDWDSQATDTSTIPKHVAVMETNDIIIHPNE